MRYDPLALIGEEFGKLTVKEFIGRDHNSVALYRCTCSCGTDSHVVSRKNLVGKSVQSCGCLRRENQVLSPRTSYVTPEMKQAIEWRNGNVKVPYKIVTRR